MLTLLALAGGAALASFVGGVLAIRRSPSRAMRAYLLHLAAGVLLAVISVELWPELRDFDRPVETLAGLAIGAVAMVALNAVTHRLEGDGEARSPLGLVLAAGIDSAVDGALIGVGYTADPALGVLLAAGLGIEKFTMTMTVCAELTAAERSVRAVLIHAAVIAVILIPAAAVGALLLARASDGVHALVLAAAAAALLYLVTMELVARGRDARDTPACTGFFFAGFVALASYALLTPA